MSFLEDIFPGLRLSECKRTDETESGNWIPGDLDSYLASKALRMAALS